MTKKFEYKIEKIKTTHYPGYPHDMKDHENRYLIALRIISNLS